MSNENVARNETARQHTPGPWRVTRYPADPQCPDWFSVEVEGEDGGVMFHHAAWRPTEANATLIAASPDLLEAAVNVVGWYFDQIYDGPPGPQDDEGGNGVESCIAELQEAIAKATGASR